MATQLETLALMNELRREKNEGMTIRVVSRFPELKDLKGMTYIGSFSWTSKATGEKWVNQSHAYDLGGGIVTPSDIARDYIAVKFGGKRLRCNSKQWAEVVKKRKSQPLYAEPCTLTNAYYIDLKSAYWQILQLGGWDCDYMPKRYLSPRSDVYDFPTPEIKLSRNCLVSMGLPSGVNVWIPNYGFKQRQPQKASVNLVLWGLVQDVLHGVASDLLRCAGAVYVNTDGYIVSSSNMPDAESVLNEWGLYWTVKHQGQAEVRGVGDYSIGGHKSNRLKTVPRAFSYIQPREIDWLRSKIKFWSKRIDMNMKNFSLPEIPEPDFNSW